MSAMEQPALRSGRITCWWSAGEDVGRLGHEVHAAEDDVVGLGVLLGEHGQAERVAPGVGPAHDLVALVVVAEDEERGRRGRPWRRRCAWPVPRAGRRCSARQAGPAGGACAGCLLGRVPWCWPVGAAWSLLHGDGVPGADMSPIPGGAAVSVCGHAGRTITVCGAASPAGTIPDAPGLLPVQGRRGPGDLRRQGGKPPPAPLELLRRPPQPPPAHRPDGGHGRVGRVDPGAQRGRGADARVQPHQAAPAPVQHPAARRQELPVPGHHPRRGVAAGDGDAGPQAQGRAVLRPLRPRLRHPGDARPAAAHVPDPHVLAATSSTSTSGWAGRACCSTSRSARARASARSTRTATTSSCRS